MTEVRIHRLGINTPASVATRVRMYRAGIGTSAAATKVRLYRTGIAAANVPPYAGLDQVDVEPFAEVTLAATDPDSIPTWQQTGGSPTVALSGTGSPANRTFIAPATFAGTTLTFTAYDELNNDSMTVTVLSCNEWTLRGGVLTGVNLRTGETIAPGGALDLGTFDTAIYG